MLNSYTMGLLLIDDVPYNPTIQLPRKGTIKRVDISFAWAVKPTGDSYIFAQVTMRPNSQFNGSLNSPTGILGTINTGFIFGTAVGYGPNGTNASFDLSQPVNPNDVVYCFAEGVLVRGKYNLLTTIWVLE
jgi:hypothetical protein